ncbi:pp78/83 [Oxyplax ochracea nucleopolyhedrovirus]|uniref:Pp78/83 n=1 Tax=Oxyplax ochracea nucleopolyhedrovirus TaxID=2083176 RepID=A0A2L0WTY2_9ABAC|nr:pp78/83 [Oxyplax ochracea nucleopolyhedrovirus]AVA31101.1 pp78/83 [Oxyplax ochracea nucleopolyhedrovirus]
MNNYESVQSYLLKNYHNVNLYTLFSRINMSESQQFKFDSDAKRIKLNRNDAFNLMKIANAIYENSAIMYSEKWSHNFETLNKLKTLLIRVNDINVRSLLNKIVEKIENILFINKDDNNDDIMELIVRFYQIYSDYNILLPKSVSEFQTTFKSKPTTTETITSLNVPVALQPMPPLTPVLQPTMISSPMISSPIIDVPDVSLAAPPPPPMPDVSLAAPPPPPMPDVSLAAPPPPPPPPMPNNDFIPPPPPLMLFDNDDGRQKLLEVVTKEESNKQIDNRNQMLSQIKSGIKLKKIDASDKPKPTTPVNDREQMLSQIKSGIKLKKVNVSAPLAEKKIYSDNPIAEAIHGSLKKRRAAQMESSSEAPTSENEDWDDDVQINIIDKSDLVFAKTMYNIIVSSQAYAYDKKDKEIQVMLTDINSLLSKPRTQNKLNQAIVMLQKLTTSIALDNNLLDLPQYAHDASYSLLNEQLFKTDRYKFIEFVEDLIFKMKYKEAKDQVKSAIEYFPKDSKFIELLRNIETLLKVQKESHA